MELSNYHENPQIIRFGALPAHAYFIPFPDEASLAEAAGLPGCG